MFAGVVVEFTVNKICNFKTAILPLLTHSGSCCLACRAVGRQNLLLEQLFNLKFIK